MAKAAEVPGTRERVQVYEVGPRDGLQNEARVVGTEQKLELISALRKAGLTRIEVSSFVHPTWIPQLSDAEELSRRLEGLLLEAREKAGDETPKAGSVSGAGDANEKASDPDAEAGAASSSDSQNSGDSRDSRDSRPPPSLSALVPNPKGLTRALAYPAIDTVAVFLSASETHNKKNVNRSVEESLAGFSEVIPLAKAAGKGVRAYISTVWGCPFEGEVPIEQTLKIARRLFELGADQISLGDTIGVGNPGQTHRICSTFLQEFPASSLALHMHDTWGMALANVLVGLQLGIRTFDSSIGGLGGCPYAPGAAGNLATEDLVYMLHGMGFETGIDWEALINAGLLAQELVGRDLPSKALRAALAGRASC